uniref:Uncharacterized protein n=1 Tax=Strongyloides papillosus TaxID=174720 RepID=A0A0N5BYP2_STREA
MKVFNILIVFLFITISNSRLIYENKWNFWIRGTPECHKIYFSKYYLEDPDSVETVTMRLKFKNNKYYEKNATDTCDNTLSLFPESVKESEINGITVEFTFNSHKNGKLVIKNIPEDCIGKGDYNYRSGLFYCDFGPIPSPKFSKEEEKELCKKDRCKGY